MVSIADLTVERRVNPLGIDARQPRFGWRLSDGAQAAYQIELRDSSGSAVWDSNRLEDRSSTYLRYGGPQLKSCEQYQWRVRVWTADGGETDWSAPATFEIGLLSAEDWSADWIQHLVLDTGSAPEDMRPYAPAPLLRRTFQLDTVPRRARLYITALGLYEASLNGARIGEEWLTPGWTDYHSRIQYQVYDLGNHLRVGENVLAVRLGDGWYSGSVGAWGRRRYGDKPALLAQLELQLESGQRQTIASNSDWRTADGGTWMNDLQHGERTKLRNEPTGWTATGFDDSAWQQAVRRAAPGSRLVAARDGGIHVVETLPAQEVRSVGDGRHIVDLGANAAGVVRLRVNGTPDQHVVVRHAEALDANGELYVENLRGAEQQDEYVLSESGHVTLAPRFTFHGFRYAEVSGINNLKPEDAEYRVLSSATRLVGTFECSDPRVEQLQRNIVTSLHANFISIPTDCPQRNERLGWTADLQIFAPTALFIADVANMLDKWLDDLVDAQLPSGAYPDIAPTPSGWQGSGNTAWSDAGVIVPWILYTRCGDAGVLERTYGSMRRFMEYLERDQTDGLRFAGRYGDWVSLGAKTDKHFIGTAYLAYVANLFTRIARVLDKFSDAEHYAAFARQVRDAFRQKWVAPEGRLTVETQTAYAMAIGFNLLSDDERIIAGQRLAQLVEEAGTHLATGFLGTPLVMPALSDTGHHELACKLLRQDEYPSWLFEVANGATSIWERWNGWTPQDGFYSPRMNSFNHYAFGAVGDWMYRYLAGLQPVEPGYRRTVIHPRPGGGFTAARASHESLYGTHGIDWHIIDGVLHVEAQVPPNTTATVVLEGREPSDLTPGHHILQVPYSGSGRAVLA
ncbi:MAG: family 78 glycoside hydrolase catalytic domain [Chloroflexi bacterium]|nr:family 78 glycoside hydrolase catalytic domain [Chloroflexota bacterium]